MNTTNSIQTNDTITVTVMDENGSSANNIDVMMLLSSIIASVGIISNLNVVLVFINNKKLRRKIPNIFIINQVSHFHIVIFSFI